MKVRADTPAVAPRSPGRGVTRRRRLLVLLGLALVVWSAPAAGQVQVSTSERFFRIEWQLERGDGGAPVIVGSLRNHYAYPVQRVQLQARVLDGTGRLTQETVGVMTDVPAGSTGTFRLPLQAAGARYEITVHSFEFGAAQSP